MKSDVSRRKQRLGGNASEEALRESEERYRLLFHKTPIGIFHYTAQLVITECNDRFAEILHSSREKLLGLDMKTLKDQSVIPAISEALEGREGHFEGFYRATTGPAEIWASMRTAPLFERDGTVRGGVGIVEDITDRKKMEKEILEVKRDWEDTFNDITDMITIHDRDFNIVRANKAAERMLSLPAPAIEKTLKCYTYYHGADCPPRACPSCDCLVTGRPTHSELFEPHLNMFVEIRAIPRFDSDHRLIGLIHIVRDITERKRVEEALHESEERYRDVFEGAHDMIQSVSPEGKFIFVNTSWLKTMGYTREEIGNRTMFDVLDPGCMPHCMDVFKRVMTGEPVDNVEATFVGKDGRRIHVEGNVTTRIVGGKVIATHGIFRNITDRKKAEEEKFRLEQQLRHSQKMEAIGTLTARISHEFKNFLTAILGYSEFLQEGIGKEDPLRKYADMVHTAAIKAEILTQGLLAYSRRQIINLRPVKLNAVVDKTMELLASLIGEDIQLTRLRGDGDMIVMADPDQIDQMLMNLCINARDAMPKGGLITLETGLVDLDKEFREIHGYGKAGKYALLSLTDTGTGMDEKTRERIFEPFFTTKESGKGTGLGLAVVYGIVKQHNGYIDVRSEPGEGTSFTIYLPLLI
jgi:two-component system cell cycle sensor histidine kinase/response regulator CckA